MVDAARPQGPTDPAPGSGAQRRSEAAPNEAIPTNASAGPQQQQQLLQQLQAPAGDDEDPVCIVCHDAPRLWGFLHGDTMHMGVCGECKGELERRRRRGRTCPVCREPVDSMIRLIQA